MKVMNLQSKVNEAFDVLDVYGEEALAAHMDIQLSVLHELIHQEAAATRMSVSKDRDHILNEVVEEFYTVKTFIYGSC